MIANVSVVNPEESQLPSYPWAQTQPPLESLFKLQIVCTMFPLRSIFAPIQFILRRRAELPQTAQQKRQSVCVCDDARPTVAFRAP